MIVSTDTLLTALHSDTAAFGAVAATADPDAPVVWCGDWRLRDLVGHLGFVHRWAAEVVRTGVAQKQGFEIDPGMDDLAGWYTESASILLDELARTDPRRPCWNFLPDGHTSAFWFRRQVHETAVPLADARRAAALPVTMDPGIAADGIDEVLRTLMPAVRRWAVSPPLPRRLLMRADDTEHSWTLMPGPHGPTAILDHVGRTPDTTVVATAQDLLLTLWKRTDTALTPAVSGDEAMARAFLASRVTP